MEPVQRLPLFVVAVVLLANRAVAFLSAHDQSSLVLGKPGGATAKKAASKSARNEKAKQEKEWSEEEAPCQLFSKDYDLVFENESDVPEVVRKMRNHSKADHLKMHHFPSDDIHNPDLPDKQRVWGMRRSSTITWKQQKESLTRAGRLEQWCALARDNWSCASDRYVDVLKELGANFSSGFRLESWPRGFRLYAEGNSFLAQQIYSIICESKAQVWKMESGNSIVAYSQVSEATILFLGNHEYWNENIQETISMLKSISFIPDAIVLASLNDDRERITSDGEIIMWNLSQPTHDEKRRVSEYTTAFNGSRVIKHFGFQARELCMADFHNCVPGGKHHQCVPGPIYEDAMGLAANVIGVPPPAPSPLHPALR